MRERGWMVPEGRLSPGRVGSRRRVLLGGTEALHTLDNAIHRSAKLGCL